MRVFKVKEELVQDLTVFGLSVNQAKAYLSIIQSVESSVSKISTATKIHQQDVYKILPKLEEMGLITKTIERPVAIKAIPPNGALNHIIDTEERKANQKIKRLKQIVKNLARAIEKAQEQSQTQQETPDIQAIFLTTDNTINTKLDFSFEKATTQCDNVLNFELLRRRLPLVEKRYQALAAHKVKTRLIIDDVKKTEDAQKILKQVIPPTGDFAVRRNVEITVKPYLIIDNKEIFIMSQRKTPRNFPCILWTNSLNIISTYQENFEKVWNKSQPITIW
jgi:sugar-specific transcriptional regulator TrmB